jgi:hypothetical protein
MLTNFGIQINAYKIIKLKDRNGNTIGFIDS